MKRFLLFSLIFVLLNFNAVFAARYILSSTPDGRGIIKVNDDVKISLKRGDQEIVLVDDESSSPSEINPIIFDADDGDELTIEATDTTEPAEIRRSKLPKTKGYKELSPLYLVNYYTGRAVCIFAGMPKHNSSWRGTDTFLKIKYSIGTPMKVYCLSSVPTGCHEIEVSDDLPLFKVDTENFSIELHPDNDGKPRTHLLLNIALPVTDENDKPIFEFKLTNIYKDSYTTPLYLVPLDGIGFPIALLDHPIEISGDCKDYNTCSEVTFYSFKGTLDYSWYYLENPDFVVEYSSIGDPRYYGFWIWVSLLKNYPVPMYIYFTEPDERNVFINPSGVRYKGRPIYIDKSFCGPFEVLADMDFQKNLFIAGTYTVNVADIKGKYISSYNFTIDTLEKDIESLPSEEFNYPINVSFPSGEVDSDEVFLRDALLDAEPDEGVSFNFASGNETITCNLNTLTGSKITKGFAYKPISYSDFKLFFVTQFMCEGTNSTQVDESQYKDKIKVTLEIETEKGKIKVYPHTWMNLDNATGSLLYAELPVMDVSDEYSLKYKYEVSADTVNGTIVESMGPFSATVFPVEYKATSAEGYINGARMEINVSKGGVLYTVINFALNIKKVNGENPEEDYIKAEVHVDTDGDNVDDMVIDMKEEEPSLFKAISPIVLNNVHGNINYYFTASTRDGKPVTGLILQNVFTFNVNLGDYPVAIKIGGDRKLVLGELATFTFLVRTGEILEDKPFDIYLGLYRKGRGTIWLINRIPGAWVLATSSQKKPLIEYASFKDFRDGRYMFITLQIPHDMDVMSLLYPGEYAWIMSVVAHDSGGVLAELSFPFIITTP